MVGGNVWESKKTGKMSKLRTVFANIATASRAEINTCRLSIRIHFNACWIPTNVKIDACDKPNWYFKKMLQGFRSTEAIKGYRELWTFEMFAISPGWLYSPDSKIHGAHMGPTWVLSAPGGPHVGPTNLAIWELTGGCVCHPDEILP